MNVKTIFTNSAEENLFLVALLNKDKNESRKFQKELFEFLLEQRMSFCTKTRKAKLQEFLMMLSLKDLFLMCRAIARAEASGKYKSKGKRSFCEWILGNDNLRNRVLSTTETQFKDVMKWRHITDKVFGTGLK